MYAFAKPLCQLFWLLVGCRLSLSVMTIYTCFLVLSRRYPCAHAWPSNPASLRLHFDGSFCPESSSAAWCVVVICLDQQGRQWSPGHFTGSVSCHVGIGDYLGAEATSSDVAVSHGLSWALMYVAQFGGKYVPRVQICFDSTCPFGMGASFYNPNTNHALVIAVSGLCDLLRAATHISWLHEPSHEGLPFNEFADVGAKWQRTSSPCEHSL